MTATYTLRNNFKMIDPGTETNTWGVDENITKQRMDEAFDGMLQIAVSGDVTLVEAIDATDQVHFAIINIQSGSGGRVILPFAQKRYIVRNGSFGDVSFTNGGSGTTVVHSGQIVTLFNDGVDNVYQEGFGSTGNIKDYCDAIAAEAKSYTDNAAIEAFTGTIPAQSGNAGKYFYTDGANATWNQISITDVTGLNNAISTATGFTLAAALVL